MTVKNYVSVSVFDKDEEKKKETNAIMTYAFCSFQWEIPRSHFHSSGQLTLSVSQSVSSQTAHFIALNPRNSRRLVVMNCRLGHRRRRMSFKTSFVIQRYRDTSVSEHHQWTFATPPAGNGSTQPSSYVLSRMFWVKIPKNRMHSNKNPHQIKTLGSLVQMRNHSHLLLFIEQSLVRLCIESVCQERSYQWTSWLLDEPRKKSFIFLCMKLK